MEGQVSWTQPRPWGLFEKHFNTRYMSKKTSSPANAFGSGKDLIGMTCKGSKVVDASRQYIHLENGQTVERAGNRVEHDVVTGPSNPDNGHYETDDL